MPEKIKIVTDSTTSLTKDECEKMGIVCLETTFMIDGVEHHEFDNDNASLTDFYDNLDNAKKIVTGCVNIATFEECFENLVKDGFCVMYVGLSASLSSTFSNAKNASDTINEKYGKKVVGVADTRCASYGTLILIERIMELEAQGKSLAEIEEDISESATKMSVAFVSPDLSFMFKNGRLSALELGIGKLLKIVPIIYVGEDGKLKGKDKCIGKILAMRRLKTVFSGFIKNKKHTKCYITSCNMGKEVEELRKYISSNTDIKYEDIKTGLIDKTLSCHCGPKTVAIFCL